MGNNSFDRWSFLKGAAARRPLCLASIRRQRSSANRGATARPGSCSRARQSHRRSGSDYLIDVIKATGIENIASNPGWSFRSLQVHRQLRRQQEAGVLTCIHEESSVAMAHGDAKVAVNRWASSRMARSVCSTRRWRFTTPGATARR